MNVYEIVTNKIIECLNQGVIPWRKDWASIPYSNYCTKKSYQGTNQLLLTVQCILNKKNYASPFWLTWKQIKKLKGSVKKDEKASMIIYYDNTIIEEEVKNDKDETEIKEKKIYFLKYYSVFNWEQTTDLPEIVVNKNEYKNGCEEIINNLTEKPVIRLGANPVYYQTRDFITMPHINNFKSSDSYYSNLYHELIHWTGHKSRLDRFSKGSSKYGSEGYSKEELIAELGSSFLCHITGIQKDIINNQASYIKGWLEALNNDKKLIIQASSQAQKATDYILLSSINNAQIKSA